MKIKSSSWHYQFFKHLETREPINSCDYLWGLIKNLLLVLLVSGAFLPLVPWSLVQVALIGHGILESLIPANLEWALGFPEGGVLDIIEFIFQSLESFLIFITCLSLGASFLILGFQMILLSLDCALQFKRVRNILLALKTKTCKPVEVL
jgi:hypothetical protein